MTLPIRRPWPRTGRSVVRYSGVSWWVYRLAPRKWEAREFHESVDGTNNTLYALRVFPSCRAARTWCITQARGREDVYTEHNREVDA